MQLGWFGVPWKYKKMQGNDGNNLPVRVERLAAGLVQRRRLARFGKKEEGRFFAGENRLVPICNPLISGRLRDGGFSSFGPPNFTFPRNLL